MLSEAFLSEIGDMTAYYHEVPSDMQTINKNTGNNPILTMAVSGDPCREKAGYMIAYLAIYFVIYHIFV